MNSDSWVLLGFIALIAIPILIGIIRSRFNHGKTFYGDEMNKIQFKRTKRDEAYEKSSTASKGNEGTFWNG
jgi:hypothetical protein